MIMKINIVDVICLVNDKKVPVGHEEKAINQAAMLIDCEKEYTVGKYYKACAKEGDMQSNPITIEATDCMFIKYMKCIVNSIFSICINTDDIIWFINMNEAVLWAIMLLPKKCNYILTTYIDWDQKFAKKCKCRRIRKVLIEKALGKVDLLIVTNPHYHAKGNYIHLPDFYLDMQYERYIHQQKTGIVCVGVMSENQGILEIAKAFRDSDERIVISGYFRDKEYFHKVRHYESDNVVVRNVVLSYEEYIKRIGEAKYVVIPYRDSHANKTSGVLQETIALNSIPVSFPEFLRYNNVEGIAFEKYEDIPGKIKAYEKGEKTVHNDWSVFSYHTVQKKFNDKLSELINKTKEE